MRARLTSSTVTELSLGHMIEDIADALKEIDATRIAHKSFAPGIGPFGEAQAVKHAFDRLKDKRPDQYRDYQIKRTPDLLLPGRWALEFKLVRPFGDNGLPAEHWSENVLHPYEGNTSSIGDCLKLVESGLNERKAIVIIGYEHTPPRLPLEPALKGFELLAREVAGIILSERVSAVRNGLVHPHHQQLLVCGFEILGLATNAGDVCASDATDHVDQSC